MRLILNLLNQVFEIEKKANRLTEQNSIGRNINKLKELFSEKGLVYEDPTGEVYNDSRSDCEARISGNSTSNLYIVETIKPIIRQRKPDGGTVIRQRALVIVESKQSS